ncbi:MAG TPA: CinA family protein [Rectinemataceae bacterium]|nr:CinA family protein [Rectinemataceae bacterium]
MRSGEPETCAASLITLLKERGLVLATAESCTGGMVASLLTDIAGSSAVFWGGVIVYSDESKRRLLGVDRKLIESRGAVSLEVARAMAEGILKVSGADFSLAITGIAGPAGATPEKPVGFVCFAWADRNAESITESRQFEGDRAAIRAAAAAHALSRAAEFAIGVPGVARDTTVDIDKPMGPVYSDR